jgi:hypothetical protein
MDAMDAIDVDEIVDVNYEGQSVEVTFKDGSKKKFSGSELPEVLAILNHWTPPTA